MAAKKEQIPTGDEMTEFEKNEQMRSQWENAMDIATEEEIARMSNPEAEKVEKESDPFDVFNDYFDDVKEIEE